MKRLPIRWLAIVGMVLCCLSSGCNLGDPGLRLPHEGCLDDGDCEDHGACSIRAGVGTCACNPGYLGDSCDECDSGYMQTPAGECLVETTNTNNNTTMNTNNNTTGECGSGEVMFEGMCVTDGCAAMPCGDGTCTVTGDGAWQCECPNGTSGIECPRCEDGCMNGTCDVAGTCVCDRGWAGNSCNTCAPGFQGVACDMCAANAFGPNCETCATLNAAEPWWDVNYQSRQALIVYNPGDATRSILSGVVVAHSFNHTQLVNMGADPGGADIRVVASPDTEVDRLLGFDAAWNRPDTTIWFPTTADITPNTFRVFYMYARNALPDPPLETAANVLRQNRGWFSGPGGPVYSPGPLFTGQYSIQLRQKNPATLQVYFHDAGDEVTAVAQLRVIDTTTGVEVQAVNYGSGQGSSAVPANVFDELTGLPNSVRLDVLINGGDGNIDTAAIYLGSQLVMSGTTTLSYQATLSRAVNQTAPPELFVCAAEMAP